MSSLQCCICGKDHRKREYPQYRGGIPQIYSAQKAQKFGDVGHSIPLIYAVVDNKQEDHQASIIDMDGKHCDQVVSILIDTGFNYSYVSPDLVDKCGLNKEIHA